MENCRWNQGLETGALSEPPVNLDGPVNPGLEVLFGWELTHKEQSSDQEELTKGPQKW